MTIFKTSAFLWIWLPILAIIAQGFIEVLYPAGDMAALHSEGGPHEILQAIITSLAALMAIRILLMPQTRSKPFVFAWVGIALLACIYITGEELSWGQHIFNWGTPEYWQTLNDQGETNFHNTSSWLDQKPRLILEIGILIGGIIIPILQKLKISLPQKFDLIYPDSRVFVTSIIALGINIVDKIDESSKDISLMHRASEVEEVYLFYFVLLYLIYLQRRLSAQI